MQKTSELFFAYLAHLAHLACEKIGRDLTLGRSVVARWNGGAPPLAVIEHLTDLASGL